MRTVDEVLAIANQLPPTERRELVERLEAGLLASDGGVPSEKALEALLEIEGHGIDDNHDVARDKYRHLADAYASRN